MAKQLIFPLSDLVDVIVKKVEFVVHIGIPSKPIRVIPQSYGVLLRSYSR